MPIIVKGKAFVFFYEILLYIKDENFSLGSFHFCFSEANNASR